MAHFPSPPRAAGPSTTPSSAPARCPTRTRSRPSTTSSSARRSSRRTWLNVGRVEQLAADGQLLHQGDRRRPHVGRRRARHGRRGPRVPQHLPPPRQQARVERLPRRGDERHAAASSPASTTAGATTSRATLHLRAAGGRVLRPRQGRLRPRAGAVRRVGGVHLREPRPPNTDAAARLPRRARRRARGLPVRRDDRRSTSTAPRSGATGSSSSTRSRSSTTHRFCTRSRRPPRSRASCRATASRRCTTSIDGPHGMVSSWGGMAPPKDLSMVKPIERVLRSGLFGPWDRPDIGPRRAAARAQPGAAPGVGHRLVRVLPQLHAAGLGAGLVPHVPLLADVVQHATSSRARSTSCRRRTPRSACARSSPR